MKNIKLLISLLLIFWSQVLSAQNELKIYEKDITIPTYLNGEPDKVPQFYTGRAYQGAQGRIYPYAANGNLTDEKKDVVYKGLILENQYLEICVLPELGGRFYSMKDKVNGYDVLYKNNVIKPSLIGMLGAWISGGVEWNIPHHHRASTFMPSDYKLVENSDGSKTIWVGELEIRHQTRWSVGLTMFPDKAIVRVDIKFINQTPQSHQLLAWLNTAVATNNDYQIIFPPNTSLATFHRKIDFTEWPISNQNYMGYQFNGEDISWWKNTPKGGSFFAWEDKGNFLAGIDHGKKAGICMVGNKDIMIGKKVWTWGTSERAKMWDQILTDNDGPYIELMTGVYSNNQPDYSWCAPYFTKEASVYFMPIKEMKNVKASSIQLALNFEKPEGENFYLLELNAFENLKNAQIQIVNQQNKVWEKTLDLTTEKPQKFKIETLTQYDLEELKIFIKNDKNELLVSYQAEQKKKAAIPEEVKPPKAPNEIETVEALCFTGLRIQQIYNPNQSPLPYYLEALKREPNHAFGNLLAGSWYLSEGLFEKAEMHLQKSVDTWSTDYTRPKDCEAIYLLGLTKKALGKEKEAFELFYQATWDYEWFGAGHLQLALLESKAGNFQMALDHTEKAISVNTKNVRALELKLSLLRKLGLNEKITELQKALELLDPLNFYLSGEKYLGNPTQAKEFECEMRGDVQKYLDLAVKYGDAGMYSDGVEILTKASEDENQMVANNPLVFYYLGYFNEKLDRKEEASAHYEKGSGLPIDFCFPFRFYTKEVLQTALKTNSKDAKALYYLGNLWYDHQPALAMELWTKALEIQPDFAMAQRNLAFGFDHAKNDEKSALIHIEKALEADNSEAIFFDEQDKYSEKMSVSPEVRLNNLKKGGEVIYKKNNTLARKVNLEIISGDLDEALEILQNHHFRKVEGVGNIHNSWVNGWMLKGAQLLKENKPNEAIDAFGKTLEYPRNLEIGNNNREGQSYYFLALAHEKAGKKKKASEYYKLAINESFPEQDLFYKALALQQLKRPEDAKTIYKELIEKGEEGIKKNGQSDYFNIFGDSGSSNVRLAKAFILKGLGFYGLKETGKADEAFKKARDLDPSNFVLNAGLFLVK